MFANIHLPNTSFSFPIPFLFYSFKIRQVQTEKIIGVILSKKQKTKQNKRKQNKKKTNKNCATRPFFRFFSQSLISCVYCVYYFTLVLSYLLLVK